MTATEAYRAALQAATVDQTRRGRQWYALAEHEVALIAQRGALSHWQAAALVATLSPRLRWDANLDYARHIATQHAQGKLRRRPTGLRRQAWERVRRVLSQQAAPSEAVAGLGQGPKVRAFYSALTGNVNAVCIDQWMIRASQQTAPPSHSKRYLAWYATLQSAVRDVAYTVGKSPRETQATIWLVVREA